MQCDDALLHIADLAASDDAPEPALATHVASCTTCHAALDDVRRAAAAVRGLAATESGSTVDVDAVIRAAAASVRPRWRRVVRLATRAAVLLLAVVGAAALFDARVEAAEGRLALTLRLPGADRVTPTPTPTTVAADEVRTAELATAVEDAVQRSLRPAFEDLASWMAQSEERRDELAAWLEARREQDTAAVATVLADTREEVRATRASQEMLWRLLGGPPLR